MSRRSIGKPARYYARHIAPPHCAAINGLAAKVLTMGDAAPKILLDQMTSSEPP